MIGLRRSIEIKTPDQIRLMRAAGAVVADMLLAAAAGCRPGTPTSVLNGYAADVLRHHGAQSSFLGYHGFPATICVSVNDEVVHGIPGSRLLRSGDLVSIDAGAVLSGWHGDATVTVRVPEPDDPRTVVPGLTRPVAVAVAGTGAGAGAGETGLGGAGGHGPDGGGPATTPAGPSDDADRLSTATRAALWAGLDAAVPGARLSDIGAAVSDSLTGTGLGVVTALTGHGIGRQMHMYPDVLNVGPGGRGPVLRPGMVFAVEPMVTAGDPRVSTLSDGWTVVTDDGGLAAHWEHTVAVTGDGPQALTLPAGAHAPRR